MHIKINTQQMKLNFLSLIHGLKTRLEKQQTHQELIQILSYAFTLKNKHKSRLNISGRYKIVIT
jgi:hypothetical protein